MSRIVNFNADKMLIMRDKFGTNLSDFVEFKAGKNELKILENTAYYQSKENERFFVYDGTGELDLEADCQKCYDFSHLNVVFLDYYLTHLKHHPNADEVDKRLIDEFVSLLDSQLKSEVQKITPPYYSAIQARLVNGL